MKPVPVLAAVVTLGVALAAVSWIVKTSTPGSEKGAAASPRTSPKDEEKSSNPLPIAKSGPYPKAVLVDGMHEFGAMELGQQLSHAFVIRNEGDAPLLLAKGAVQCKCTVPTTPDEPIPPGGSVEVLLEWKPTAADEEFHQMAQIWTNDPENPELELHVKGAVTQLFYLLPSGEWQVNRLIEDDPMRFSGIVMSPLVDDFEILDYKGSSDLIKAEFEALSSEELAEHGAKSGYRVDGTIEGETPIGKFRETLTINTDVEGGKNLAVRVAGFFPGPFSIIGNNWYGGEMLLQLGQVKSSEGKTVTLSMFTPREEEPLQMEVEEATPPFLQLAVEQDAGFDAPTRERYLLTFTIPAGAAIGSWQEDHRGKIHVKTNRDSAPEFDLYVDMTVRE